MMLSVVTPVRERALVAASAAAGALAVPLHIFLTPVSAALSAVFAVVGLLVWRWSRLPLCQKTTPRTVWRFAEPIVWTGIGLAIGLVLLATIRLVIEPSVPSIGARIAAAGALPVWRRVVIIYVAAVGEELIFRLLLLSAVVGIVVRALRLPRPLPSRAVLWTANGIAGVAFAFVHLPAWGGDITPQLALSVLALNAIGGLVLGTVFVKWGIVAAMWTHAGADCAMQLIGPLTG